MRKEAIGYYSGWGMIYITDIKWGIDEKVEHRTGSSDRLSVSKIQYNKKGDAYFVTNGHRIPLSECIRVSAF